jgi:hypothetical protein
MGSPQAGSPMRADEFFRRTEPRHVPLKRAGRAAWAAARITAWFIGSGLIAAGITLGGSLALWRHRVAQLPGADGARQFSSQQLADGFDASLRLVGMVFFVVLLFVLLLRPGPARCTGHEGLPAMPAPFLDA